MDTLAALLLAKQLEEAGLRQGEAKPLHLAAG
ncbi:hypothetical protein J2851_007138 [Azospirillum rugosum]|uniref:Uncharacterized protein n=1 Tax=Azospirillum rugosum TaxID=416170 RepID=A0ABS4SXN0_9PROT|nr:hypothetical protein [Azospirillum rugosum]MDQ0531158.1 hypothetical protein [Azospirillum rugosum]